MTQKFASMERRYLPWKGMPFNVSSICHHKGCCRYSKPLHQRWKRVLCALWMQVKPTKIVSSFVLVRYSVMLDNRCADEPFCSSIRKISMSFRNLFQDRMVCLRSFQKLGCIILLLARAGSLLHSNGWAGQAVCRRLSGALKKSCHL